MRLMDIRGNRGTVAQAVHRDVGCGYALVACIRLPEEDGTGVGNLPESLAGQLRREPEEILRDALRQSETEERPRLTPLWEMVFGPEAGRGAGNLLEQKEGPAGGALVLTTGSGLLGAAALYYPGITERIGEILGEDYYVLPSSVHEVLILPGSDTHSPREMAQMVKTINEEQVRPEERLGNRVLRYRRADRTLEVAWDMDRQKDRRRER